MGKVLLVDDELIVIKGLRDYINWDNCGVQEVYTAMNAGKAKTILTEKEIDVMIVDIEMPGESGTELLHWSKQEAPDVVCIFLSSHAEFDYAQQAVTLGAYRYLLKPSPIAELESAVSSAIEESSKRRMQKEIMSTAGLQACDEIDENVFAKAKRYILEHLETECTREDVAGYIYMNPDYLSKLFKKKIGKTFGAYVLEQRLHVAKQLLKETNLSIQEIAGRTGFNSAAYFCKIFKREEGITPTVFRYSSNI